MKSLHESMLDPDLFGQTFSGPTFANWRTVAKVLDGLPLERNDSSNFRSQLNLYLRRESFGEPAQARRLL
jgi:hypothetical protein